MKRKLWIIPVLAVLLALICCGTASADDYSFTTQPGNYTVNPDSEVTISWATNFNPVKIELVSDQGQFQTNPWTQELYWISDEKVVKTITTDLSRSMSEVITYDEAVYIRWKVRAYYFDDEVSYVASDFFEISRILRSITTPANVNVEPGKQVLISWKTNFNPIRIEILQDQGYYQTNPWTQELYWVSDNRVVKTINSNLSRNMSIPMRYDEVSESYSWRDKWFVRAYSENDWSTSDAFTIDYPFPTCLQVTFDSCGHGTAPESQDIWIGHYATQPENPTADGFVFGGWYTRMDFKTKFSFSSPVLENMTLYAWWGHTMTFDMNGQNENYNRSCVVREGEKAEPYTRYMDTDFSGWLLTGWYTEPECVNAFDFNTVITGDITLYAKWEYDGFAVTYDWNGSHNVTRWKPVGGTYDIIDPDEPVTLRARTGDTFREIVPLGFDYAGSLVFTGWYTEPECMNLYDFTTIPAEDTTLYAGWAWNPTISYVFNHPMYNPGTGFDRITIRYGTAPSADAAFKDSPSEWPTWKGHTCLGWFADENCTVPFDIDVPLYQSVTIYLGWEETEYTITWDANGSSFVNGNTALTVILHYGDRVIPPEEEPLTIEGKVFKGYGYLGSSYASGFANVTCMDNATYYAVWIPEGLPINNQNFPDANFREYVSTKIDTDGNGYLSVAERAAVTKITYQYTASDKLISNMKGLEHFPELTQLFCIYQSFTSLNLSNNTKLTKVTLGHCDNLASLDFSGCVELTELNVNSTALTSLNLNNCTSLQRLECENAASLTSLNLRSEALKYLSIYNSGLQTVDISACPILCETVVNGTYSGFTTLLFAYYNHPDGSSAGQIIVTNADPCPTAFITYGIPIDEAHFPDEGFRRLVGDRYHDLNGNGYLTQGEIDQAYSLNGGYSGTYNLEGIQYLPNISYIVLKNVGMEHIDLSANPLVNTLVVSGNHLTEVDVSMLTELTHLDVAKNPGLVTLTLGSAPLETLNCYPVPAYPLSRSERSAASAEGVYGERRILQR